MEEAFQELSKLIGYVTNESLTLGTKILEGVKCATIWCLTNIIDSILVCYERLD